MMDLEKLALHVKSHRLYVVDLIAKTICEKNSSGSVRQDWPCYRPIAAAVAKAVADPVASIPTLVERVAKAIGMPPDFTGTWENVPGFHKDYYRAQAEEVIAALRSPRTRKQPRRSLTRKRILP